MDRTLAQPDTSNNPLISVIIPAYNVGRTLGAQLDALHAQTYQGAWEVVLVDNSSTDDTLTIAEHYQSLMPNLHVVRATEQQGSYYARNVGAQAARGEVFVFCDGDDVAAPDWLEHMVRACREHDFVVGMIDIERLNQAAPWRPKPFANAQQRALDFLPYAIGATMAVSRRAYEAVGGYDNDWRNGGDIDLSWRLQLQGYSLVDAPGAVMHYRYRESMKGFWRQIVTYAEVHVLLYTRYAQHGMPPSSPRMVLSRLRWLIRHLPNLFGRNPRRRSEWIYYAATRWGRLRGSLRYRVMYL